MARERNKCEERNKKNLKVQNREAYKITFVCWVEWKLKWKWRRMLSSSVRTVAIASDGGARIFRRNVLKKKYGNKIKNWMKEEMTWLRQFRPNSLLRTSNLVCHWFNISNSMGFILISKSNILFLFHSSMQFSPIFILYFHSCYCFGCCSYSLRFFRRTISNLFVQFVMVIVL